MKFPGIKERKTLAPNPKEPFEIEDIDELYKSDNDPENYKYTNFGVLYNVDDKGLKILKDFGAKFMYQPAEDGTISDNDIKDRENIIFGTYKDPSGKSRNLEGYKTNIGNTPVIVINIEGGDVVFTKFKSKDVEKLAEKYMNTKDKHFSFFSNLKDQLTDAPVEVKKAFNDIVNYFAPPGGGQKSSSKEELFEKLVGESYGEASSSIAKGSLYAEGTKRNLMNAKRDLNAVLEMIEKLEK